MQNYKTVATQLIKELESTPYFVSGGQAEGLSVMAYQNSNQITFSHNLGGSHVPTKTEATEMLHKLTKHYQALREASTNLVDYLGDKSFVAEVIVFSGQMDFPVCKMVNEEITWFSNLKD